METIKNILKDRYDYARYLAIAATVSNLAGIFLFCKFSAEPNVLQLMGALGIFVGLAMTLCAYCLGGLWTALKSALSIAMWGLIAVPFPFCLVAAPVSFVFAALVLILVPVIPVSKALQEHQTRQYIAQHIR